MEIKINLTNSDWYCILNVLNYFKENNLNNSMRLLNNSKFQDIEFLFSDKETYDNYKKKRILTINNQIIQIDNIYNNIKMELSNNKTLTNIVSVKYEDKYSPKTFSGKSYSYFTDIPLKIGDIVEAPTQYGTSIAMVSKINISSKEITDIIPYMKTITEKINKGIYLNSKESLEDIA